MLRRDIANGFIVAEIFARYFPVSDCQRRHVTMQTWEPSRLQDVTACLHAEKVTTSCPGTVLACAA
jgi:hypothetical protein